MSKTDRLAYENEMSERYIERWGERADKLRLCLSVDHNETTSDELYINNAWMDTKVRYLDIQRYNDWIATQK